MEYDSAIKMHDFLIYFHVTWLNLENISFLRNESQTQEGHIINLYEMSIIGKSIETESRLVVAESGDRRPWRMILIVSGLWVMKIF